MLAAYAAWGILPVYWKALDGVPALTILCHRIAWSMLFVGFLLAATRRVESLKRVLADRRVRLLLCGSSLMIGVNWLVYIWAVNEGKILETALGYYINPLVNVFFGVAFLKDRLRPVQWAAIALAAAGVSFQVALLGHLPAVALGLALSFSLYGLIRKLAPVDALTGLFVETLVLVLPALAWLILGPSSGFAAGNPARAGLLAGTGLVTSVPLIWFAYGARRLSLVTVGLLQYLSPTIGFAIGMFLYGEKLSKVEWVTFACVWAALALYSASSLLASRETGRAGGVS
ncbi:MAG: EamA family transporter RarD [Synergistaceae bacterium]|nr:EamA family transporter RarD [Synergistaceae bacterium]